MGSNIVFKYGNDSFQVQKSFFTRILRLIFSIIYFYANKYNFLFNHWIQMKFYQTFLEVLFYITLKVQINSTSRRPCNKIQELICGIYISFLVDLRYFFYYFIQNFYYYYFQNCLRCLSSIINRVIRVYLSFLVFIHDILNKLVFCIIQYFSLCLNKILNLSKYN